MTWHPRGHQAFDTRLVYHARQPPLILFHTTGPETGRDPLREKCMYKLQKNEQVSSFANPFVSSRLLICGTAMCLCLAPAGRAQKDPGVRGGQAGAGNPLPGLSSKEATSFSLGSDAFQDVASVTGSISGTEAGLGPRFNLDSCGGCHIQPALGGSSPDKNPQVTVATLQGASNVLPSFITLSGPIREARFKFADPPRNSVRDGGVHALFTITGRTDAVGCKIAQPNFTAAVTQNNVSFRIPTPTYGL